MTTAAVEQVRALLGGVALLRDLDPAVLDRLTERVQHREWQPGEMLVEQGDPGDGLIVLTDGAVTVYRHLAGDVRAALAHLRAPTTLGEVTLLDGAERTASVQAVEPCTGLLLQREDLLAVLGESPVLLDALLRSLGGLVRRLSDQAADHLVLDLPGRVAKTLVVLAAGGGGRVSLSQSRIAELAGGSRQSLNKVLGRFAERGLLRVETGGIVLEDVPALRRRAGLPPEPTPGDVGLS